MPASPKHRFIWTFLCLWSLLALAAPQMMWACSMTGKVASTPAQACPCMATAQGNTGAPGFSAAAHKCCDSLPLPAGDTTGHGVSTLPNLRNIAPVLPLPFAAQFPFVMTQAVEFAPPAYHAAAFLPTISPPLISQHSPTLRSGRAPPF